MIEGNAPFKWTITDSFMLTFGDSAHACWTVEGEAKAYN